MRFVHWGTMLGVVICSRRIVPVRICNATFFLSWIVVGILQFSIRRALISRCRVLGGSPISALLVSNRKRWRSFGL